jgi:hypothetical protein
MARRPGLGIRLWRVIGLTLLLSRAAWATQLVPLSEAQLIEQSSLIVVGQCTEAKGTWMGRRLMTVATIAVDEVLKGEPHSQVTVVIPGGIDAQRPIPVAAVTAGTPQLAPSEEVVLFLSASRDLPDTYTVTGFAQGKVSVLKDAAGGEMVAVDAARPPSPDTLRPMPPRNARGALPLAQFRAMIRQHVLSRSAQP